MKNQVVYSTNADYDATYERIGKSDIASVSQTKHDCGNIKGEIKESKTLFLLSRNGTLQIAWRSLEQKIKDFEIIKSLLVPKEGEKLIVEPEFQHVHNRIPYPESNFSIKLYWCNKVYHYRKLMVNPYLGKRERQLLQLEAEHYEILLKMFYQIEEDSGLFGAPLVLIHKTKR